MSTLALAPLWRTDVGGEPTLESLLEQTWTALSVGATVACPVCHGEMAPEYGKPEGGRCRGCDSVLS